jgi:hypothetical protein
MKRINTNLLIRLAVSTTLLLGSALLVLAQSSDPNEHPKFEFFVGYSALGEANSTGISFGPNSNVGANYTAKAGFETSIIGNLSKRLGSRATSRPISIMSRPRARLRLALLHARP